MTSSWEGQSIIFEGRTPYRLGICFVILTFCYSRRWEENQCPLWADTSRYLRVCQCRLEEMLEISCAGVIIRQFCSMGRYCDLVKPSTRTCRCDYGTYRLVDPQMYHLSYRWRFGHLLSSAEC